MTDYVSEIQKAAIERINASGPDGCTSAQLAKDFGLQLGRVSQSLRKLLRRGIIFAVKDRFQYVFFSSAELAASWVRPSQFAVVKEKSCKAPGVTVKNHGRPAMEGEIIIPPHVEIQKCPSFDGHRWADRDEDGKPLPPKRTFRFQYELDHAAA